MDSEQHSVLARGGHRACQYAHKQTECGAKQIGFHRLRPQKLVCGKNRPDSRYLRPRPQASQRGLFQKTPFDTLGKSGNCGIGSA